jgi:hypothetical protein
MFQKRYTYPFLFDKNKQNRSGDLRTGRIGSETAHEPSQARQHLCERGFAGGAFWVGDHSRAKSREITSVRAGHEPNHTMCERGNKVHQCLNLALARYAFR